MIAPLSQFAESSSGIGALGIDGKAFVIQLVTFVLAFWVLKRYAFKPIVKLMYERRQTIEAGVKLGEEMRTERAKLDQQIEDALHKARQEADGLIAAAQESGRQAVREAEDKARQKAAAIIKEAEDRIGQDMTRARQNLEAELAGLVAEATEVVIQEKVDAKKDGALMERALKGRA